MPAVRFVLSVAALFLCIAAPASAHFPWLVSSPEEHPAQLKLYFGEAAEPDDPDLLDNIARSEVFTVGERSEPQLLTFKQDGDALVADLAENQQSSTLALRLSYGVITRGDATFLLKYYAKAYPAALPGTWQPVANSDILPLEVTPRIDGDAVAFTVTWQGKPAADATVTVVGPGLAEAVEGQTDAEGVFRAPLADAGRYSIRAKITEETAGEFDGKTYAQVRHYSTLTLNYVPAQLAPVAHDWPDLPRATTSFGGAVLDGWLYVYGGHYGEAHHYSREGQSGDFARLNLRQPAEWETLPGGPKLTGLALVAHGGKLYRVGGFTANNGESEDQSLWSQSDFARFDPATKEWESLPPLAEGRSSHDAAIVGDTLYVVGGWNLQGDAETKWHDTAWAVDLSEDTLAWKEVAQPPFHRRALALAEWEGKLYVLGGMREEGGPTTEVAVYDPKADEWSAAPALLGTGMDGFGAAAFAADGRLFATTMSGSVQRLTADGSRWEFTGQLAHPRFFHEMLPSQPQEFVIVGGAHMATGKIVELERLPVSASATARSSARTNP